jgi:ATP-binding cassette subfamily A (ABC1) protein 3
MKMMGLSNWLHWTAWFIKYFLLLLISAAIETMFFIINTGKHGAVIGYTSPGILFVFLTAYTLATISFCFAISTFFSRG